MHNFQSSAAQLNGVNLQVGVYDSGTYYNDYWLAANSSMGIVNYGHRAVPHVYLGAPLLSPERTGADSWNASHWSNAAYDDLFDQFTAAADLDSQRAIAGEMQTLLNDEVVLRPYSSPHLDRQEYVLGSGGHRHGPLQRRQHELLWITVVNCSRRALDNSRARQFGF